MRPWTTRSLQAAVAAAGIAAAGTGTATAAGSSALTDAPDDIRVDVPADTCVMPDGVAPDNNIAPCADVNVTTSTPNVVKTAGADITTMAHGIEGELQDGQPVLAPGKPNRVLGHAFAETTRIENMTQTRPNLGVDVEPGRTGFLDQTRPGGGLLDAEVGPRGPSHEGFSAADTAVDLTAAQGHEVDPMFEPVGMVTSATEQTPLQSPGEQVGVPAPAEMIPAVQQVPATTKLDDAATRPLQQGVADIQEGMAPVLTPSASTVGHLVSESGTPVLN
ncbi:hypothetical protein GIY23_18350 [Allosaccharopolyspora coralli]|uniref:DUF320 domain-containing protein n=1 Tax=Allosaccharopolyspora coralli TaxID=2665642 RepID=A0A5Q3QBI3_9PSEU|nr:hypothetical protein [Allosaccharopolyspora coralli]QGK71220.1 hypothetical protein GIY23_18350 [Allosaccharopolyspora coralli]